MPAEIHDRAMHLLPEMKKTYGPKKAKEVAFAVASQQAHARGETPKGFGTPEGRRTAKAKFDKPKSEYKPLAKHAGPAPWRAWPSLSEAFGKGKWEGVKALGEGAATGLGRVGSSVARALGRHPVATGAGTALLGTSALIGAARRLRGPSEEKYGALAKQGQAVPLRFLSESLSKLLGKAPAAAGTGGIMKRLYEQARKLRMPIAPVVAPRPPPADFRRGLEEAETYLANLGAGKATPSVSPVGKRVADYVHQARHSTRFKSFSGKPPTPLPGAEHRKNVFDTLRASKAVEAGYPVPAMSPEAARAWRENRAGLAAPAPVSLMAEPPGLINRLQRSFVDFLDAPSAKTTTASLRVAFQRKLADDVYFGSLGDMERYHKEKRRQAGRGALAGLGIGGLAGGALAALPRTLEHGISRAGRAGLGGAGGAALGALIGAIAGGARKTPYEKSPEHQDLRGQILGKKFDPDEIAKQHWEDVVQLRRFMQQENARPMQLEFSGGQYDPETGEFYGIKAAFDKLAQEPIPAPESVADIPPDVLARAMAQESARNQAVADETSPTASPVSMPTPETERSVTAAHASRKTASRATLGSMNSTHNLPQDILDSLSRRIETKLAGTRRVKTAQAPAQAQVPAGMPVPDTSALQGLSSMQPGGGGGFNPYATAAAAMPVPPTIPTENQVGGGSPGQITPTGPAQQPTGAQAQANPNPNPQVQAAAPAKTVTAALVTDAKDPKYAALLADVQETTFLVKKGQYLKQARQVYVETPGDLKQLQEEIKRKQRKGLGWGALAGALTGSAVGASAAGLRGALGGAAGGAIPGALIGGLIGIARKTPYEKSQRHKDLQKKYRDTDFTPGWFSGVRRLKSGVKEAQYLTEVMERDRQNAELAQAAEYLRRSRGLGGGGGAVDEGPMAGRYKSLMGGFDRSAPLPAQVAGGVGGYFGGKHLTKELERAAEGAGSKWWAHAGRLRPGARFLSRAMPVAGGLAAANYLFGSKQGSDKQAQETEEEEKAYLDKAEKEYHEGKWNEHPVRELARSGTRGAVAGGLAHGAAQKLLEAFHGPLGKSPVILPAWSGHMKRRPGLGTAVGLGAMMGMGSAYHHIRGNMRRDDLMQHIRESRDKQAGLAEEVKFLGALAAKSPKHPIVETAARLGLKNPKPMNTFGHVDLSARVDALRTPAKRRGLAGMPQPPLSGHPWQWYRDPQMMRDAYKGSKQAQAASPFGG